MLTIDYLLNDVKPLTLSNTIADAKNVFSTLIISHLPIVENGVFYGLISECDIQGYGEDNNQIKEIRYTLQTFFTKEDVIWLDLLKKFSVNDANLIPVLDKNNTYIGYYELSDILQFLSKTPFLQEKGNILVLSKNQVAYSISEVSQIVESNDAHLYGVIISGYENENVILTIKLYSKNINDVIHTFRRYNYNIIIGINHDEYLDDLKNRSDYLQKYLNI